MLLLTVDEASVEHGRSPDLLDGPDGLEAVSDHRVGQRQLSRSHCDSLGPSRFHMAS